MTDAINNNTSARKISWPFRLRTLTAAVAYASALGVGGIALTAHASEVTWDDILNDHNNTETVLMYGMGVKAQRYSPLNQINADNVEMLTPAWSHSFGDEMQRGQESQALIHEGVIYVT
ncbi:MAG: PQQ-dependent dehydrogenase, methanol/ethanol family, partial [Vreelandella alkaliphila]